jgi:CRP/FNR family transcriptional regulator
MADKKEVLTKSIMFAGLSPLKLDTVLPRVFEKRLERDEMVFNEGTRADALYFVAEGVVKAFKTSAEGKDQIIAIMRPGDFFNDVPIFDHGSAPASVQAMGRVLLFGIHKDDVDLILKQYPEIGANMLRMLAMRIRYLISLVEDLSFRSVAGRVAKILLENAGGDRPGAHRLTQRDMAAIAGTAREVVSRALKLFEEEGLIRLEHHRIVIKNVKALKLKVEPLD